MKTYTFKILLTVFFLPGFLLFPGDSPFTGVSTLSAAESASQDQVVVYQFHRRFRCPSCHKLEALITKTLNTHYSSDMESGGLVFRVVNLDDKSNKHFIKDYDLLYNTVVIVDKKGGKEIRFKDLERIWEIYEDEEKASKYLRGEIDEYLSGD